MKTIHWELHYRKYGENKWEKYFSNIESLDKVNMDVERRYAKSCLNSEVKLVRVESTVEYFNELV